MATQNLTGFSTIREGFPSLSDIEFNVIFLYACGATLDEIADFLHTTKPMIKKRLNSSKIKLSLESVQAIRTIVNIKLNLAILNKIS